MIQSLYHYVVSHISTKLHFMTILSISNTFQYLENQPTQSGKIAIYIVNHHETVFKHPELSKIMGVLAYETLHILHNEINSIAIVVHSNLRGGQHGYLGLVVSPTAYSVLTNTHFVSQFHPVKLIIPIATTHHYQEELKSQYDKNYDSSTKHEEWNGRYYINSYWLPNQDTSQPRGTGPLENSQEPYSCSSSILLLRTVKYLQSK